MYSKLWFSKFKKCISSSVLGELQQLTQISLNFQTCGNLKIRGLGVKLCGFLLFYVLKKIWGFKAKEKSPCFLLNKNRNFNKNKTESKMKNSKHTFREMNLFLAWIRIANKSKTVMSWSSRKKKECIFL